MKEFKQYLYWNLIQTSIYTFAPQLIGLTAFFVYTAAGNELTPAKAFTTLALFNVLRFPIGFIPILIRMCIEAGVSFNRINSLLSSNEAKFGENNNDEMAKDNNNNGNNSNMIVLDNCTFTWDDEGTQVGLSNISASFPRGSMTMIIGETGSGKSSFLRSILGDLNKTKGKIFYDDSVIVNDGNGDLNAGYSSQVAWIQNATVRDNIFFGKEYNEEFYQRVIEACSLIDDFEMLTAGDKTEIGEKGINLSGGQKQRVSLARACYSDYQLYMFDDCLSAVDSHVANHIFNHCFINLLRENGKTVIFATHTLSFLQFADNIIAMNNDGTIKMQGTLKELENSDINLMQFIVKRDKDNENQSGSESDDDDEKGQTTKTMQNLSRLKSNSVSKDDDDNDHEQLIAKRKAKIKKPKTITEETETEEKEKEMAKNTNSGKLIEEEERGVGEISLKVYKDYLKAAGGIALFGFIIFWYCTYNLANIFGTFWLGIWSDDVVSDDDDTSGSGNSSNNSSWFYLGIYALIQFLSLFVLLFGLIAALFLRIKGSRVLHSDLLNKLLHVPMSFYDVTPIGRIVNRFSKDVFAVDSAIPDSLNIFIRISLLCLVALGSVIIVTPYFIVAIIPVAIFYYYIQKYYIATARELRRISAIHNSPIFSHISETINGYLTVIAFGKRKSFNNKNRKLIDNDNKAWYTNISVDRWIAVRLEMIANFLIGFAALSCAYSKPSAGFAGVALTSIFTVTQALNYVIMQKAQLEQNAVSVERIDQYTKNTQSEAPYIIENSKIDNDNDGNSNNSKWPQFGKIEFKNVYMRYRPGLPHVLKGISLTIKPGEKCGVIGRTGAGKSSLFLALLRLVEIEDGEGNVIIDDIDVSTLGLQTLRSRISIIPQDPVLFTGTVRFNLDPFNQHKDEEIIEALKLAHCWDAIEKALESQKKSSESSDNEKENNNKTKTKAKAREKIAQTPPSTPLNVLIEENGNNFSLGQRQLLCLARAIVRRSQILLLDEVCSV